MERTMKVYGGKVYGVEVSTYGLSKGYLDYQALAGIVGDLILNNTLMTLSEFFWELESGKDQYGFDINGYPCDVDSEECYGVNIIDVYQTYIISEQGYNFLSRYTDEIVYYCEELDIYLWGITHFGTSWDYVLTDIKLEIAD